MRLFADDSSVFAPVTKVEVTHEQLVKDRFSVGLPVENGIQP